MRIHIKDNTYLTSDTYNYCISKLCKYTDKEGKGTERMEAVTFHNNIDSALNSFKESEIRTSEAKTFKELKECLEGLRNTMSLIYEELK